MIDGLGSGVYKLHSLDVSFSLGARRFLSLLLDAT